MVYLNFYKGNISWVHKTLTHRVCMKISIKENVHSQTSLIRLASLTDKNPLIQIIKIEYIFISSISSSVLQEVES